MKVLQVNCVYGTGSTGKIVFDIHSELLRRGYGSVVCYGRKRGVIISKPNVYKFCTELEGDFWHLVCNYFEGLPYGGMFFATNKLIKIIESEKPDVVHLHCVNGYTVNIYKLLAWLGNREIKTVVTNHAEFFYTGNCGHSYDCKKWILSPGCGGCPILREATGSRTFDITRKAWLRMWKTLSEIKPSNLIFTAVSPWVKKRFEMSPIMKNYRCQVVENGLNADVFNAERTITDVYENIRSNKPIVLHVTADFSLDEDSIKGGRFVVELAKRLPSVQFVVVAYYVTDLDKVPDNLFFWGRAKNQYELAALYRGANVTILTSKRETFSMVTAESLSCGTPVVGFKAGGPESIALPNYSEFVDYGNIEALKDAIISMLEISDLLGEKISLEALSKFSSSVMVDKYIKAYNELINN